MTIGLDPTVAQIRQAIQRLERRVGNTGTITLKAGVSATTVVNSNIGATTTVVLTPASVGAANETGWWVEPERGSFTIHHKSGGVGRTFRWAVLA